MKHMFNLLILLSLSFGAQAGPGGPAIESATETAAYDTIVDIRRMVMSDIIGKNQDAALENIRKYIGLGAKYAEIKRKSPDKGQHVNFKALEIRRQMAKMEETEGAPEASILIEMSKYAQAEGLRWRKLEHMLNKIEKERPSHMVNFGALRKGSK